MSDIKSKIIMLALTVFIILFVVSGAISLPLFFRSFYYAHIDWLDIPESTGYTEQEARDAFDEMMDYCMGKSDEFGTGTLAWSEEGKSHFDDCKKLFSLDKAALIVSAVGIVACAILVRNPKREKRDGSNKRDGSTYSNKRDGSTYSISNKRNRPSFAVLHEAHVFKRAGFFAGATMLVGGAVLGVIGVADFDAFFVKFHHTFFPGKDNWLFDPTKDEIIKILPEEFFRNCAILIVSVIVLISVLLIVNGIARRNKN